MIPVEAVTGGVPTTTSLFPRNNGYLVPVKLAVQRAAAVGPGDSVTVELKSGRADGDHGTMVVNR